MYSRFCASVPPTLIGSLPQNVAPGLSPDAAQRRPLCAWTIERQIASPIPMPFSFVVKKASKTVSGSFNPTPESCISTRTVSSGYGVTVGSVVQIQVTNDMGSSNVVTNYVSATAPGVFTQNQQGTGYGEIEHLGIGNSAAPVGSVVTDANPAMPGEALAVYLTGLGAVSPAITDGAVGPSGTLSYATSTIGVQFSGITGTNDFAGLAPNYSGLYQLNVTVPPGLTAGPN